MAPFVFVGIGGIGAQRAAAEADDDVRRTVADIDTLEELTLEELLEINVTTVTTTSRRLETSNESPATVYVLTRRDIAVRGYQNLKDIFRDLPGMDSIEYYFSEIGTAVPVRGLVANNAIVVLWNGMRVNPPGGEEMMFRADFSIRDVEQIEIVYGPGSTLYGRDAISLVVNVKSKRPAPEAFDVSAAGGWPQRGAASASFSQRVGKRSTVLGYVAATDTDLTNWNRRYPELWAPYKAHAESLTSAMGKGVDPARYDRGLNAAVRFETEDSSFQLWHRQSERNSGESYRPDILGFVPEAVWSDMSTVGEARNTLHLSKDVTLESTAGFNRYQIHPRSRYVFSIDGDDWFYRDHKYGLGLGMNLEEKVDAKVLDNLNIVAGIQASQNNISPKATVPDRADPNKDVAEQGGAFVYQTDMNDPATTVIVPRVHNIAYQTLGLYAEAQYKPIDRLKLIGGMRVDKDTRYSDTPLSPRLAVIYSVSKEMAAKLIYTQAYIAPPPYFAYGVFDNGSALNTSNPALAPERARSIETNFVYQKKKQLELGLSLYANQQTNLLIVGDTQLPVNVVNPVVYVPNGDGTFGTRKLTHSTNAGESYAYGTDLYGRAHVGPASGWASYSFVNASTKIGDASSGMPGIPRHQVRLGVTYAILDNLFTTASLKLSSTPKGVVIPKDPTAVDPALVANAPALRDAIKVPYTLDLHVLWTDPLFEGGDLFLNVQNLTNNHYAQRGLLLVPAPKELFSAMVGARVRF